MVVGYDTKVPHMDSMSSRAYGLGNQAAYSNINVQSLERVILQPCPGCKEVAAGAVSSNSKTFQCRYKQQKAKRDRNCAGCQEINSSTSNIKTTSTNKLTRMARVSVSVSFGCRLIVISTVKVMVYF